MPSIRPNVLRMEPYAPGKPASEVTRELGVSHVTKLASNENPLGPSPKAIEAVREAAAKMNIYPDASGYELKVAISKRFSMPYESILLGNGSDELIHMIGLLFLDSEEDELMVGDPSFVRYDAAAYIAPAKLVKVPLDDEFRHDLDAMRERLTDRTKLVFIANPNNPTGTIVRKDAVNKFLDAMPAGATLVLDEAYFEFAADAEGYPDSTDLVREGRNVIGLRTFSKTYGLAGIRIGFGFASPVIVDAFNRAREPFNVNSLAQAAAIAALDDDAHIKASVENNRRGMKRVLAALQESGATPCESHGNFVFANLHRPAAPIFQAMMRDGVVVRSGEIFGTPTCIRVSIGTDDEVSHFVEAFAKAMKETQP